MYGQKPFKTHNDWNLWFFQGLAALAEAAWSNDNVKDFDCFQGRINKIFGLYQKEKLEYYDFVSIGDREVLGPDRKEK